MNTVQRKDSCNRVVDIGFAEIVGMDCRNWNFEKRVVYLFDAVDEEIADFLFEREHGWLGVEQRMQIAICMERMLESEESKWNKMYLMERHIAQESMGRKESVVEMH